MATSGKVTRQDRERAWNELQGAAKERKTRPFYRAVNKQGFMYAGNSFWNLLVPVFHFHFIVLYLFLVCLFVYSIIFIVPHIYWLQNNFIGSL